MHNNENDQPLEIAVEIFAKPNLLNQAFIETPCESSWDKMTGNDSVRFCGQCSLNVYNVANLTDKEAEAVFTKGREQGRVCARLYRRPDGTIMTDNCPRSLRRIRDASRWLKTKIVAGFALTLSLFAPAQAEDTKKKQAEGAAQKESQKAKMGDVSMPPKVEQQRVKMGEVYIPPKATGSTNNSYTDINRSETAGGLAFAPPDLTSYKNQISNSLKQKWKTSGIQAPFPKVQFKLDGSGKVAGVKIITSSGNKETDIAAVKAITTGSPFSPPPLGAVVPIEIQAGGQ